MMKNIKNVFVDAFCEIKKHNDRVDEIRITPKDYSNLISQVGYIDCFDANTHRETLQHGLMGTLFGAQVYLDKKIDHTTFIGEHVSFQLKEENNLNLGNVKFKFIFQI